MATAQDDLDVEKKNWHWRNSMRPVRFFNLDARAALPFFLLLVYARPVTIIMTVASTLIFRIMEKRGLSTPAALRTFRVWLMGYERPSWYTYARRRMRDFG